MIKTETFTHYITEDGLKFFDRKRAEEHEKKFDRCAGELFEILVPRSEKLTSKRLLNKITCEREKFRKYFDSIDAFLESNDTIVKKGEIDETS